MNFYISTYIIIIFVIIIRIIKVPLYFFKNNNNNFIYNNDYKSINYIDNISELNYNKLKNLKIISWNIQGLFFYNKPFKIDSIIETLKFLDADIICLQECFSNFTKNKLINNLKYIYPNFLSGDLNKKFIIGEDSGLLILSKYPIKKIHFEKFNDSYHVDIFSNKGFLVFNIMGLNIINTHMQSNYNYKINFNNLNNVSYKQFTQLYNYINNNSNILNNFILLGDFNINLNNINNFININNMKISNNKFNLYTLYDKFDKFDKNIDYIFINKNNKYYNLNNLDYINLIDNPSDHNILIGNLLVNKN